MSGGVTVTRPQAPRLRKEMITSHELRTFRREWDEYLRRAQLEGFTPEPLIYNVARELLFAIAGRNKAQLKEVDDEMIHRWLEQASVTPLEIKKSWRTELAKAMRGCFDYVPGADPHEIFFSACGRLMNALSVTGLDQWLKDGDQPAISVRDQLDVLLKEMGDSKDLVRQSLRKNYESIFEAAEPFVEALEYDQMLQRHARWRADGDSTRTTPTRGGGRGSRRRFARRSFAHAASDTPMGPGPAPSASRPSWASVTAEEAGARRSDTTPTADDSRHKPPRSSSHAGIECLACHKFGHIASRCRSVTPEERDRVVEQLYGTPRTTRSSAAAAAAADTRAPRGRSRATRGRSSATSPAAAATRNARRTSAHSQARQPTSDDRTDLPKGRLLVKAEGRSTPTVEIRAGTDYGADACTITEGALRQLQLREVKLDLQPSNTCLKGMDAEPLRRPQPPQVAKQVEVWLPEESQSTDRYLLLDLEVVAGEEPTIWLDRGTVLQMGGQDHDAFAFGFSDDTTPAPPTSAAAPTPTDVQSELATDPRDDVSSATAEDAEPDGAASAATSSSDAAATARIASCLEDMRRLEKEAEDQDQDAHDLYLTQVCDVGDKDTAVADTEAAILRAKTLGAPDDFIDAVEDTLRQHPSLADPATIKTPSNLTEFRLEETEDARPIHTKPTAQSPATAEAVRRHLEEMLEWNVVEPIPPGEPAYTSPVLVLPKPKADNPDEKRICVDLRRLNKQTRRVDYPLPTIASMKLNRETGTEYFAKLDLAKGYWQVNLEPSSR